MPFKFWLGALRSLEVSTLSTLLNVPWVCGSITKTGGVEYTDQYMVQPRGIFADNAQATMYMKREPTDLLSELVSAARRTQQRMGFPGRFLPLFGSKNRARYICTIIGAG